MNNYKLLILSSILILATAVHSKAHAFMGLPSDYVAVEPAPTISKPNVPPSASSPETFREMLRNQHAMRAGASVLAGTATAGYAITRNGIFGIGIAVAAAMLLVSDMEKNTKIVISTLNGDSEGPILSETAYQVTPLPKEQNTDLIMGLRTEHGDYYGSYFDARPEKTGGKLPFSDPFTQNLITLLQNSGANLQFANNSETLRFISNQYCSRLYEFHTHPRGCIGLLVKLPRGYSWVLNGIGTDEDILKLPRSFKPILFRPSSNEFSIPCSNVASTAADCHAFILAPAYKPVEFLTCPEGSRWSYEAQACLSVFLPQDPRQIDGICYIDFSAKTGCPLFNDSDYDCQLALQKTMISANCGTPTAPPTVKVVDKNTGTEVEVQKPHTPGQGSETKIKTREITPDGKSTTEVEQRVKPGTPTASVPKPAPVTTGTTTQTYPGTGSSRSPDPAPTVTVENWPEGLGAPPVINVAAPVVNIPDRMKIDGEITDFDDSPEQLDPETFLDPLKERLTGFTNFSFPAHSSQCPVFNVAFTLPGGMSINENTNFMCEIFEDNRSIVSAFVLFGYLIIAIRIVLEA